MKNKIILGAVCLALCSCNIYKSEFDCPAGKGVGCRSVNEVLTMIVDKEEGEDLFEKDTEVARLLKEEEKKKRRKRVVQPVAEEEKKKLYLLKEQSGEPVLIPGEEK